MNKKELNRWFKDKGDKTKRINYDLNENSIVFDVGGYKGEWAEKIFNKYSCNIYIFEPVNIFYQNIKEKFKDNKKIKVFNFGLSNKDFESVISLKGDSSSMFKPSTELEKIYLKDVLNIFKEEKIHNIDLMKVNIEGGEYDLLKRILFSEHDVNINNFQIQFHDFIPGCKNLRNEIQEKLEETHTITYNYEFVWENWKRK